MAEVDLWEIVSGCLDFWVKSQGKWSSEMDELEWWNRGMVLGER